MTVESQSNETDVTKKKPSLCVWLVALGALLLYGFTLNHWVTLTSLPVVAKVTGWDWHTTYLDWRVTNCAPLLYIVTLPFRWLPQAWQPAGMNFLSAICAALTLALLARSVRLLPQDRTRDQRLRELHENALLSDRESLLPQILAVAVCGLQLTFWENAVAATGEMLDLLVFAYLIRCLLEFRVSQSESWLTRFVVAYGMGVANNWALVGFFPFFLVSLIWIKGIGFFDWRFVGKLTAWGVSGLLLYLLIPAVGALTEGGNFFTLLHIEMLQQKQVLLAIPRWIPAILAVPTIVALFFVGIRWPSFQGDMSAIGSTLGNLGFRIMHVLFFGVSLWIFFDFKYSPRVIEPRLPFLTFYYMAALSVGYFCGYFMVMYGKKPAMELERHPEQGPGILPALTTGLLVLITVASAGWLAFSNFQKIQLANGPALSRFAAAVAKSLPDKGAIILSDDHTRLLLLEAAFQQQGRKMQNVLIETGSLQYGEYLCYLQKHYPQLSASLPTPDKMPAAIDSLSAVGLLQHFSQNGMPLYYLHPSFGFFFEVFYTRPHGLVQELKLYTNNATGPLDPPALTAQEITENQNFWNQLQTGVLAPLPEIAKTSSDAAAVGWFASRSLNSWGVELQKANHLKEAAERFNQAVALNPQNHMAQNNKKFNSNLQDGNTQPLDTTETVREALMVSRSWEGILTSDGPADEPSFQMRFGEALAAGGNLRQAYILFHRRLELRPHDFEAQLAIAKTLVDMRFPDKALTVIREAEPQATNPNAKTELLRVEALSYMTQTNFPAAEKLLLAARQSSPNDERRANLLVEFYCSSGVAMRQMKQEEKAKAQFKCALTAVDDLLRIIKAVGKNGSGEESDALLKRAQLQLELTDYDGCVLTLGTLLQRQPDSPVALMTRAIAQLQSKKYAGARRDYQSALKIVPAQAAAIYYGLAEIAYQEKDKKTAIKHYRQFLKLIPATAPEYKQASDRLTELTRAS